MDKTVKQRCLAVLRNPSNARAMTALVNIVARQDAHMAEHLRQFRATGQSRPYGFVWGERPIELRGTQYIIVRAIPKPLGVQFACRCALQVLPYLEESHPNERSASELIELVEQWLSGTATKKAIQTKSAELGKFGVRINRQWHHAFGSGEFDSLPRPELDLSQRPLFCVEVVGYAAQSVGLSKSKTAWLIGIDRTAESHMETEFVGRGKRGVSWARKQQLKFLAELIEAAE